MIRIKEKREVKYNDSTSCKTSHVVKRLGLVTGILKSGQVNCRDFSGEFFAFFLDETGGDAEKVRPEIVIEVTEDYSGFAMHRTIKIVDPNRLEDLYFRYEGVS